MRRRAHNGLRGSWGSVVVSEDKLTVCKTQPMQDCVLKSIQNEIWIGSLFPGLVVSPTAVRYTPPTVITTMPYAGIDLWTLVTSDRHTMSEWARTKCVSRLIKIFNALASAGILVQDVKPNNMCVHPYTDYNLQLIDTGMFCSNLHFHSHVDDTGLKWHDYVPQDRGVWELTPNSIDQFYAYSLKKHVMFFFSGSPSPPQPHRFIPPHLIPLTKIKTLSEITPGFCGIW